MRSKCLHCPLADDASRECPGQKNGRVCYRADPKSQNHTPGILAKILGFTVAAAKHFAAGMPTVTAEVQASRLAICQACEHYEADRDACTRCGCGMTLKVSWAESQCPLDPPKWGITEPPPAGPAEP